MTGPLLTPIACAVVYRAMPRARLSGATALTTITMLLAPIMPPPTPCRMRNVINWLMDWAASLDDNKRLTQR